MPQTPIVIDLSHYQVIPHDLNDARAAGIEAVIHKCTEGLKGVDAKAEARYSLAKDAGMLFGLYHFLRPGNIRAQADFFLDKASFAKDALLVCDFEVEGIHLYEVLAFLRRVEEVSGQKPVLYAGDKLKTAGGAKACPELLDYRLWLAQYTNRAYPTLPKGYEHAGWWLWQYSEKGSIAGIDGSVDLNAYDGDADALRNDWVLTSAAGSGSVQEQGGDDSANSTSDTDPAVISPPKPIVDPSVIVPVPAEKPSIWAKIMAAFAGLTGIGINAGTLIQQKITELTPIQIGYLVAALALIAFGIWIYNKAAKGAQERNLALIAAASDPHKHTVELIK